MVKSLLFQLVDSVRARAARVFYSSVSDKLEQCFFIKHCEKKC